jgi:hypothetical protein
LDANVLSAPERAYQVVSNAANRPERSAVDILIVEDRRRQLVVNNDVEQVADQAVDAYLAPCRFEAETRDQVMFDLDFCWCASFNSIGSTIEGSSFSGLLTLVEIGHIRIGSAGNGLIRSPGSGSSLSQRM